MHVSALLETSCDVLRNSLELVSDSSKEAEGREPSGFASPDGLRCSETLGGYSGTVP